jgi:hypothetical protein
VRSGTSGTMTALTLAFLLATSLVSPSAGSVPRCQGEQATIVGTSRAESIHGTPHPDVIVALGGDDVVFGRGANDVVCGGAGADRLLGGSGADILAGDDGDDDLLGGGGSDSLSGGDGADSLTGDAGIDIADYSAATHPIDVDLWNGRSAGQGHDTLIGIEGVRGSSFGDAVVGSAGANTLIGGPGNDRLSGSSGDDVIVGGEGDDVLAGGSGDDEIRGGAGADALYGGSGTDTLDGGDGTNTCAAGELTTGCQAGPPQPSSDRVSVWGAEFMAWGAHITVADAVEQAERLDYIAASRSQYMPYVDDMKALSPDLTLLAYVNGTHTAEPTRYPEDWYARDRSGNKIQSVQFGTWLMDPSSWHWASEVARLCEAAIEQSGYDGCFIDSLGTAPLGPGYETAMPIDPATGSVWTARAWLEATERIAEHSSARLAPRPVFGNGISDGVHYFAATAPASRLLDGMRGSMAEMFVRPPGAPISAHRSEFAWRQDVDMLVDAGSRGKIVLAMTKVWTDGSRDQKDAWHRYALATFLLGYARGSSYFAFRYDRSATTSHPYWDVEIGDPVGGYATVDGLYERRFTNGWVYVNPTTSMVTVDLGGSFRTLEGQVVTSLTMTPYSGEVLTPA